jgi:transposase InsO family protein
VRHPQPAWTGALATPAPADRASGKPTTQILAPNDVWSADYKGQFRTGDGRYCYPLTVADGFSRYLLGCQALLSTAGDDAKPIFTRLFKEYGLPSRIRTDNGVPFATTTLARLSKLSAGWVRLGILPELIEPGRPAQNGRHERMHRTLKAETTRPAAGSLAAQQRRFNIFHEEFNEERPMRRSIKRHPRPATRHRHARCRIGCRRWSTPTALRSGTSAPMVASGGIADG